MSHVFHHRRYVALGIAALIIVGLPLLWRWTPASEWVSIERGAELFSQVRASDYVAVWVIGAYVVGAVLFLPINLFIFVTALFFDDRMAYLYIALGVAANTTVGFAAGWIGGASLLDRLGSGRVGRFAQKLSKADFWDLFLFRLIPVTPFSTLNVVCGSIRMRPIRFYAATFASILPGATLIVLFERSLMAFTRNMSWMTGAMLAATLIALVVAGFALKRWAKARQPEP